MASRSNKDLLTILLLVSVQILQGLTSELWDKRENNFVEYDDNEMGVDVNQNIIPKLVKKIYPDIYNLVNPRRSGFETTTTDGKCSCNLTFRSLPLGKSYFPGYIQDGLCKVNSCDKDCTCIPRKYVVVVLKRKGPNFTENSLSSTLPRSLRDFWTKEDVPVTVACECVREFQMAYQNNM